MHECAQISVDDLIPLRAVDVVNPLITCVSEAVNVCLCEHILIATQLYAFRLHCYLLAHTARALLFVSAVGFGNYDFNANPLSCFGTVLCNYHPGGK